MAVDAVLTSVGLGSPLLPRASQMCAWMKKGWEGLKELPKEWEANINYLLKDEKVFGRLLI